MTPSIMTEHNYTWLNKTQHDDIKPDVDQDKDTQHKKCLVKLHNVAHDYECRYP